MSIDISTVSVVFNIPYYMTLNVCCEFKQRSDKRARSFSISLSASEKVEYEKKIFNLSFIGKPKNLNIHQSVMLQKTLDRNLTKRLTKI